MNDRESVTIVEVGPRDGFQSVARFIPTERKISVVGGLIAAGIGRVEAGSFVSPKALPQMSDIRAILDAFSAQERTELSVLVPNAKGAGLAMEAGVRNIVFVLSASERHNQQNVRRSVADSMEELHDILAGAGPGGRFRLNVATAFDCPFEGRTPLPRVMEIVGRVLEWAPEAEICLCDTTGRALPQDVSHAFEACRSSFGARAWAFHAHDTYGLGLASLWSAFRQGVRIFDASVAGIGGCPFAPGATGNVATEDVVYLFESSGISTGVDLEVLLRTARTAAEIEGAVPGGRVRAAFSGRNLPGLE